MTNAKITDLTLLTELAGADMAPIVDTSAAQTKRITLADLAAASSSYRDFGARLAY